jgi:FkbM family methyltransferase
MLIKNLEQYITNRSGVIHVGAYEAEERRWYYETGFEPVYYIEANPQKFKIIQDNIRVYENQYFIPQAIADVEGEMDFYVSSNGASSSLLFPNNRPEVYDNQEYSISDIIKVKTLPLSDVIKMYNINLSEINFLNIDTEGAELMVLKSLKGMITAFEYILCEYHTHENFIGCPMVEDLIKYLRPFGFEEVTRTDSGEEWGDILFKRK